MPVEAEAEVAVAADTVALACNGMVVVGPDRMSDAGSVTRMIRDPI